MSMRKLMLSNLWFVLIYIASIGLIYSILSYMTPPAMVSDSGWGFLTWQSMTKGAPFNKMIVPDPNNILRNVTVFQAVWSPGQYLIPIFFTRFGLDLGKAMTMTTALFSLLGILGCYCLYQTLVFSKQISLASCAIIASTRFFAYPFSIYHGGEVLLFGSVPWIILLSLRYHDIRITHIPFFLLLFLTGAFLKLTFVVCAIAILLSLLILKCLDATKIKFSAMAWHSTKAFLAFTTFYLILHAGFLSKGWTVNNYTLTFSRPIVSFLFSFIGPIFSSFSIGDLINRMLMYPANPLVSSYDEIVPLLLFCAILAGVIYFVLNQTSESPYKALVFGFLITYLIVFAFLFVTGAPLTYEDRFFRPVGLLLIPGILKALESRYIKSIKYFGYIVILGFCIYGVTSFFVRNEANKRFNNIGLNGFTHQNISKEALSILHYIDANIPQSNNLFYVTSPEIALEIKRNRVMSSHADFETIEKLAEKKYRGRVNNLFVVLQEKFLKNGKAEVILNSFSDYRYWDSIKVGSFVICYQGNEAHHLMRGKRNSQRI